MYYKYGGSWMIKKEVIEQLVDNRKELFCEASDQIWEFAETRYEEYKSSALLCEILEKEGFLITKEVAGIKTAFQATYGEGKPVIAILGEYDALSSMSQKANITVQEAITPGGNGHGCGHHLLGVGSMAGAIAVKDYLKENDLSGTICYIGCPAEEGGSGKTIMAREHVFDDFDAALTWHPQSINSTMCCSMLANIQVCFKFYGTSSHAGLTPHLGRSALDAVELMNVGVNYLREHIIPDARVHYAVTNTGGIAPNVVQARADVLYLIRAPKLTQVREIYERIMNVAKGAALMTGTRVEVEFDKATSNVVINETLSRVLHDSLIDIGVPSPSVEQLDYAQQIWNTLDKQEQLGACKFLDPATVQINKDKKVADWINPFMVMEAALPGSTDVGDVSWITPTAQFVTSCYALGTGEHSWQMVTQGKSELAHEGMLYAGKVLALSAIRIMENPEIVVQAKEEFDKRLHGESYICPIPADVEPK